MKSCKQCGSYAINHHQYDRDGSDTDLCDVHYWKKRAEGLGEAKAVAPVDQVELESQFYKADCQAADKIIADYKEHYDFPTQGESHMHNCITDYLGTTFFHARAPIAPALPVAAEKLPTILFDGYAVFKEMDAKATKRTSYENVVDTLDAVVRILRRQSPAGGCV